MKNENIIVSVEGMVCISCERRVNNYIKKVPGVISAEANYNKGLVKIEYDSSICNYNNIYESLKETEYSIPKDPKTKKAHNNEVLKVIGIIILSIVVIILGTNSGSFNISDYLASNVSFLILFIIGLFSSLHCIGMCGGISMSQGISLDNSSKKNMIKPSLLYNLGRLISYSILGGIIGSIGSVFKISDNLQATIFIVSSLFMIFMGFNIYGLKIFRKFTIKLPFKKTKFKGPFIVGLLSGFMPCGPLQTMQLYALTTGSFIFGFLSMFSFALGTIPLMLTFGVLTNLLNKKASKNILKVSGIIIIVIGLSMANRGLSLVGFDAKTIASSIITPSSNSSDTTVPSVSKAKIENGVQTITLTASASGYSPKKIYIQKNVPTELIVKGNKITSCNNQIKIPSLGVSKKLKQGENKISFTAKESKNLTYSCWMGMITGTIVVVDDLKEIKEDESSSSKDSDNSSVKYYGMPIEKVPTDRLVKKTSVTTDSQTLDISSNNGDLEPAIIVGKTDLPLSLNFNIEDNSKLNGEYTIYNDTLKKSILSFKVENNTGTANIPKLSAGAYAIVFNNKLISIIEITKDFYNVNLEEIRSDYFN